MTGQKSRTQDLNIIHPRVEGLKPNLHARLWQNTQVGVETDGTD